MDLETRDFPTHKHDNKWWFWNEIWSNRIGPFDTEEDARLACVKYAELLEVGRAGQT